MATDISIICKRSMILHLMFQILVFRCMTYCLFFIMLFLLWAKPVEIVDDYTEVDTQGHIQRVNGIPFIEYLKVLYL